MVGVVRDMVSPTESISQVTSPIVARIFVASSVTIVFHSKFVLRFISTRPRISILGSGISIVIFSRVRLFFHVYSHFGI
jgi:hypothetical protein